MAVSCSLKNLFGQPWPGLLQNLVIQERVQRRGSFPYILLRGHSVLTQAQLLGMAVSAGLQLGLQEDLGRVSQLPPYPGCSHFSATLGLAHLGRSPPGVLHNPLLGSGRVAVTLSSAPHGTRFFQ